MTQILLQCGISVVPILMMLGAAAFVMLSRPRSVEAIGNDLERHQATHGESEDLLERWGSTTLPKQNPVYLGVLAVGPFFGLLIALTNLVSCDFSALTRLCVGTASVFALHAILIFGPAAGHWRNYSWKEQIASAVLAGATCICCGLFLVGLWTV